MNAYATSVREPSTEQRDIVDQLSRGEPCGTIDGILDTDLRLLLFRK